MAKLSNEQIDFIDNQLKPFNTECVNKGLLTINALLNDRINDDILFEFIKLWLHDKDGLNDVKGKDKIRNHIKYILKAYCDPNYALVQKTKTKLKHEINKKVKTVKVKKPKIKIHKVKVAKVKTVKVKKLITKTPSNDDYIPRQNVVSIVNEAIKLQKLDFASINARLEFEFVTQTTRDIKFEREDYLYYLNGGTDDFTTYQNSCGESITRQRNKSPLAIFVRQFKERYEEQQGLISSEQLKDISANFRFLQSIERHHFNMLVQSTEALVNNQKTIQGILYNDKTMVDNKVVETQPKDIEVVNDGEVQQRIANNQNDPRFQEYIQKLIKPDNDPE